MRRVTLLVVLGVLLLVGSGLVPVVDLLTSEWDDDYVYTVGAESSCGGLVATSGPDSTARAYEYDLSELSDRGRRHVGRAIENGSYRVEDEADTAREFDFAADHFEAGSGCYVVHHDGEAHTLATMELDHRSDPEDRRLANRVGPVLLTAGAASLVAAVVTGLAGFVDGRRENQ